ncbi:MAG: ABC transporter permease [Clostridiales bacterium]|nr:ABC transporter permease [Clostridiales bacterium]
MVKYIIKRLLLSVLILVGVSIITYMLVRLMPMDYFDRKFASQIAQGTITQAEVDRQKDLYGLIIKYEDYAIKFGWEYDKANVKESLTSGQRTLCTVFNYFEGYWKWLSTTFKGDLGLSFKYGAPVSEVMWQSMWISFWIALVAMVMQFFIAIALGIAAATHQYSVMDYTATVLVLMGISLPSFFFANLLLRVFSLQLGWFPYVGMESPGANYTGVARMLDILHHMVLPMVALVILGIGGFMRYTRTNVLEVLNADYIRTARAKGCSEKTVIYRHAFRNTLIPIVTMIAGILPGLFGGAMITEQVFDLPGIGNKAYQALVVGDIPFIMGYNMFIAILGVIGTLLSDLMYAVVDPRVKITK